ncbi:hypothetical protein ECB94_27575 (plasmid) [Vibrio mediterranei]|uniref:Transposase n=2 Tax=Vibrio mediterranei TaxID=689 RepID=A0A3G4VJS3_9VIBR|nr:hypothetical protein ECB94_27575 [Vibrio mediterranei]
MQEAELMSKQTDLHRNKQVKLKRPDIPNRLERVFFANTANDVWCGDITYSWLGPNWSYLPVIPGLFSWRVVG